MKKKNIIKLAQVLASHRDAIPVGTYEQLLHDIGEVLADANPAFRYPEFHAIAKLVPFTTRKEHS